MTFPLIHPHFSLVVWFCCSRAGQIMAWHDRWHVLYLNNVDLSWFLKQKWNSNAFVCFSCLSLSVLCSWCSTLTRYISKPLLLDGYKFDLRLYVLVSGCDPLRIFLHRWSSQRWSRRLREEETTSVPDKNRVVVLLDYIFYTIWKYGKNYDPHI